VYKVEKWVSWGTKKNRLHFRDILSDNFCPAGMNHQIKKIKLIYAVLELHHKKR